jgi:hypothetical protein
MVIYKIFVFGADWKSNMAARAHNVMNDNINMVSTIAGSMNGIEGLTL